MSEQPDLTEMLATMEANWKTQSEQLMQGYIQQYEAMTQKAMADMQKMVNDASKSMEEATKPAEVHMQWAEVNGQNVLVMSEKAGREVLNAFDVLAKLLPELQKLLKKGAKK